MNKRKKTISVRVLPYIPSPSFKGKINSKREVNFIKELGPNSRILNVGSGVKRYSYNVVNLDIDSFDNVNVVGKAQALPFKSGLFAGIIFRGVLQHVNSPTAAIREMYRVLKKAGQLYAEVPFIQGYHADPGDFQRYTISGIEELFSDFRMIEKGVMVGPSSAFTWILREYLAILFSFNKAILYKLFHSIFSWITLPLKYLDFFLAKNKYAYKIASVFYYRGVKD